ncbi:MAG: DUF4286 family protein [Prevotellaceae bacterium]|jgi:hypothetical protein|nr:DUF4286 family protein [Prevotellaceae bacterium]
MIIFNTTYCVPETIFGKWNTWLQEIYIPRMLETGYFIEPRVCKILNPAEDSDHSYSVQFSTENEESLLAWNEEFGEEFKNNFTGTFGNEVLYFSTLLEVLL